MMQSTWETGKGKVKVVGAVPSIGIRVRWAQHIQHSARRHRSEAVHVPPISWIKYRGVGSREVRIDLNLRQPQSRRRCGCIWQTKLTVSCQVCLTNRKGEWKGKKPRNDAYENNGFNIMILVEFGFPEGLKKEWMTIHRNWSMMTHWKEHSKERLLHSSFIKEKQTHLVVWWPLVQHSIQYNILFSCVFTTLNLVRIIFTIHRVGGHWKL